MTKRNSGDSFWRRTINWEMLRSIGASPLASVSIFMPFIGYAILYNGELKVFFEGISPILPEGVLDSVAEPSRRMRIFHFLDMEIVSRLNFLYVGFVSIGCGSILFRLCAPKTVKAYASVDHFFDGELERASARRLRSMVFTIKSRRKSVGDQLIAVAPWLDRGKAKLKIAYGEMREQEDTQLQADVLSSYYNVESRYYRRGFASVVFVLYLLGFAVISIPGLAFTAQVLLSIRL